MKNTLTRTVLSALLVVASAPVVKATVFFFDGFTNGSTLNSASPANPTATNTAYEMVSSKAWNPTPTLTANDLKMGIAATTAGYFQAQALFATNQVALVQPGDFIELTVVFTNTSGLLTTSGQLAFGLYNSGQVKPIAGGINNTIGNTYSGGAQNWQGYVGSINFTGSSSRINTRPTQSGTTGLNQDLVTFGTSSSYAGSTGVGTATGNLTLTVGATYTEVLLIQMNDVNSLAITNILYSGAGTGGIVLTNFGGIATNTTFLTSGFDGLAIGYTGRSSSGGAPTIEVSSIKVDGSVTAITSPPTITAQPVDVAVPNGGSCAFAVSAQGFNVTYQWARHGTNLINGGNISGATSRQLVISPAGPGDVLSGANGYYVIVTGAGPFSTNSVTNALAFVAAKDLTYSGSGPWDLNNSASWVDTSTLSIPETFNFGDAVTFDSFGSGGVVTLTGSYLSASTVTVNENGFPYTFTGTGSFAGPGNLIYKGSAQFTVNNANTYSGGTIISNATANLRLGNFSGLGTGPITMAMAGGQMEILQNASSSTSLPCDLIVADDFTLVFDGTNSAFVGVLNGNISGTGGKTLTINHGAGGAGTTASRIRLGGTNTVCDANIFLNDSTFVWSPSQSSGIQTYNGVISGSGSFLQKNSMSILNGPNTYTGGTVPAAGSIGLGIDSSGGPVTSGPIGTGPLLLVNDSTTTLTGSGQIFASGGARTLGNAIQFQSASNNLTLVVGGANNLTLSGAFTLNGNDGLGAGTNRTIQVTNTAATIISGVISDGGLGIGLVKTGSGALYLDANNTYTGLTVSSSNSNPTNAPGVLAGSGTIAGNVFVQTNSSIGGGSAAAIGTLTISGNLTNSGNGYFRVNRSGSASDKVSVSGILTNTGTGTIIVTNLGSALQVGDTFTLFNKAMSNGAAMTISGGGAAWLNKLAVNGTIQVVPGVNTNATNITFSVSGNVISLSWPADHTGWRLQAQTNGLSTGLRTNWSDVIGSTSVNSTNITINPANGAVFYRLVYP